ncbi:luciferin sulfotransferase-like [Aedes albopictus]|uniref:Sulfotransferase domain-containing protein n=1 Tax=Aedes albopictus TaxID=7160 RepID=A0ABM1Y9R0_AEDAL|nr:sulfotransferase 1C4-like [Aedes albopictus]
MGKNMHSIILAPSAIRPSRSIRMFSFEKINNQVLNRIECPGTEKHYRVTLPNGLPENIPDVLKDGENRYSIMIETYLPLADRIKNFQVYEDDVWVVTFPKCGTTWTQEMVWLLNNNLNYDYARKHSLEERFPFLELTGALTLIGGDSVTEVEQLARPRHIKSHLTAMLLPDQIWTVKPRIIYVSRNPKDAATSFYHHYRNIVGYDGPREHFFDAFLGNNLIYAPFGDHVKDYWKLKDQENVLFITFEQMKTNLRKVVMQVATFLGKTFTDQEVDVLEEHLSVDSMRANKSCNMDALVEWAKRVNYSEERRQNDANEFRFIRNGKIGTYKIDMSEDYIERFNEFEKILTENIGCNFHF